MLSDHLRDCVVKSLIILETSDIGQSFDDETISFFQTLYLWRRPEKFILNDNEARIIAGSVAIYNPGHQRTLRFVFDNNYIWMASIAKLTSRSGMKACKKIAAELLDQQWLAKVA